MSDQKEDEELSKFGRDKGNPHNDYFLNEFDDPEFARDFFMDLVPDNLSKNMDWSKLKRVPDNYVQEALQML